MVTRNIIIFQRFLLTLYFRDLKISIFFIYSFYIIYFLLLNNANPPCLLAGVRAGFRSLMHDIGVRGPVILHPLVGVSHHVVHNGIFQIFTADGNIPGLVCMVISHKRGSEVIPFHLGQLSVPSCSPLGVAFVSQRLDGIQMVRGENDGSLGILLAEVNLARVGICHNLKARGQFQGSQISRHQDNPLAFLGLRIIYVLKPDASFHILPPQHYQRN